MEVLLVALISLLKWMTELIKQIKNKSDELKNNLASHKASANSLAKFY